MLHYYPNLKTCTNLTLSISNIFNFKVFHLQFIFYYTIFQINSFFNLTYFKHF